jgi:hypothetical protein
LQFDFIYVCRFVELSRDWRLPVRLTKARSTCVDLSVSIILFDLTYTFYRLIGLGSLLRSLYLLFNPLFLCGLYFFQDPKNWINLFTLKICCRINMTLKISLKSKTPNLIFKFILKAKKFYSKKYWNQSFVSNKVYPNMHFKYKSNNI